MSNNKTMTLTMGPVLFNWDPDKWREFYFRIADEAPVERVVVGEIVCSKRAPFFDKHLPDVIERLTAAGKQVFFGSQILVMNKLERQAQAELNELGFPVEANDLSAVSLLKGRPFAAGPFLNIYNEHALKVFEGHGATHITLPGELSLASIGPIVKAARVPVEVFAFGRMPLAISARCYHARSHGLSKDGCQYVCNKDPNGLDVDTLDGDPFLAVNGVQTLSYTVHNVLEDIPELQAAGISGLRLSPQNIDMVEVARIFRETLDDALDTQEALKRLDHLLGGLPFSNGFLHGEEGFRAKGALLKEFS
jgi:collagenase-like PrtC family protease